MSSSTTTTRTRSEGSDLTPAHIDRLRRESPDSPVPLPAGSLACEACGVACSVEDPDAEVTTATALARAGEPPRAPQPHGRPELVTELTTCPGCHARRDVARRIVRRFPVLVARLGPFGAQHRVSCALDGLAALNQPMPDPDTVTPAAAGSLLARMSGPGAAVSFSSLLAPVQTTPGNSCSRYPWAHLSLTVRAALRTGYAGVLADRVASSRPEQHLAPPDPAGPGVPVGGACLTCGVGALTRTAADVQALGGLERARREVWTPLTVESAAIGGPGSPERLSGWCCGDCQDAIDTVGSTGQTAMARALVRHLRAAGRGDDALRVERGDVHVVGWAALAFSAKQRGHKPPAPNAVSWGHVR